MGRAPPCPASRASLSPEPGAGAPEGEVAGSTWSLGLGGVPCQLPGALLAAAAGGTGGGLEGWAAVPWEGHLLTPSASSRSVYLPHSHPRAQDPAQAGPQRAQSNREGAKIKQCSLSSVGSWCRQAARGCSHLQATAQRLQGPGTLFGSGGGGLLICFKMMKWPTQGSN